MNNKITLNKLPLLGLLITGLALSPGLALADKNDKAHNKGARSHSSAQSHIKQHKNNYKRQGKGSNRHNSSHNSKKHGHRNDHNHYPHAVNKHRQHDHGNHNGHRRTTYIVNDHHHSGHIYGLDRLRVMIGLHTDNFDIIFRD